MSTGRAATLLAALILGGCATGPIGTHQPSLATVQSLRQTSMAPAAVGEFTPGPQLAAARDKSVGVRGSSLSSPTSGSFTAYLKEALITDLRAAGKYDTAARTVISGQLIRNELNAGGVSSANSTIAAKFAVAREGTAIYDKPISVTHEWPSSFMGAVAIPEAISQYTLMYARLLDKLFADEEFQAAVASK